MKIKTGEAGAIPSKDNFHFFTQKTHKKFAFLQWESSSTLSHWAIWLFNSRPSDSLLREIILSHENLDRGEGEEVYLI
jgi:hypothetical protein